MIHYLTYFFPASSRGRGGGGGGGRSGFDTPPSRSARRREGAGETLENDVPPAAEEKES